MERIQEAIEKARREREGKVDSTEVKKQSGDTDTSKKNFTDADDNRLNISKLAHYVLIILKRSVFLGTNL